jgi:NAD(P)-dependent dehydrogenase (short-subunit alcohol dehydrogenase family)
LNPLAHWTILQAMNAQQHGAVLVTGAAKRIGKAVALDLAQNGWAVAIHYRESESDAIKVCDEIVNAGGKAAPIRADLGDEADCAALVDHASTAVGPLSCLINNASIFEKDSPTTATKESWDTHMQVNLRAPFVLVQKFAAQLPADSEGNVINVIDQRVWNLTGSFTSYTVSKAALWTLTQTLALALAPGIRVNAVGPGPTLPSVRQTDEQFRRQWQMLPLARQVDPQEICEAVRFILAAPSMTGQMIALDGGEHLGWAPPARIDRIEE